MCPHFAFSRRCLASPLHTFGRLGIRCLRCRSVLSKGVCFRDRTWASEQTLIVLGDVSRMGCLGFFKILPPWAFTNLFCTLLSFFLQSPPGVLPRSVSTHGRIVRRMGNLGWLRWTNICCQTHMMLPSGVSVWTLTGTNKFFWNPIIRLWVHHTNT